MQTFLLGLIAATGVTLATVPAHAEDVANIAMTASDAQGGEIRSVSIDLSGVRDAATIDRRIAIGARELCGYSSMWGLRPRADYVRCETAAIAQAHRQIDLRTART